MGVEATPRGCRPSQGAPLRRGTGDSRSDHFRVASLLPVGRCGRKTHRCNESVEMTPVVAPSGKSTGPKKHCIQQKRKEKDDHRSAGRVCKASKKGKSKAKASHVEQTRRGKETGTRTKAAAKALTRVSGQRGHIHSSRTQARVLWRCQQRMGRRPKQQKTVSL